MQPHFLTLDLASITRHQAGLAQWRTQFTVVMNDGTGNAETNCTGLAGGVALPHARMPGIDATRGAFLRLGEAVEFDALDDQPVDLVFALLVPEVATQEHLQLLAGLATLFSQSAFCERLRRARDRETLLELLASQELAQVGA